MQPRALSAMWVVFLGTSAGCVNDTIADQQAVDASTARRASPQVSWKAPVPGATLTGLLPLDACEVTVTAEAAIAKVDFFVDGRLLDSEEQAPWRCSFDTRQLTDGEHQLEARAVDVDGNAGAASISILAQNSSLAPSVQWVAPAEGATLSGALPLDACEVTVTSAAAIAKVDFFVDGRFLNSEEKAPWNCALDTTQLTDGTHRLEAQAVDEAGNIGSAAISVSVRNSSPALTVQWTAPAAGATLSGMLPLDACEVMVSAAAAIVKVDFFVDGQFLNSELSPPWNCALDTTQLTDGTHRLEALAVDAEGNAGSATVSFVSQNPTDGCGNGTCDLDESCVSCAGDCSCGSGTECVASGPCTGVCASRVAGFSSAGLQQAINDASIGSAVLLPAGDYAFSSTVMVSKPLTLCGAANLTGVAEMESGDDVPPQWDGTPSRCFTTDIGLEIFQINANDVKLIGLKVEGVGTTRAGKGLAIAISSFDRLTVEQCEASRFMEGVQFSQSQDGRVHKSWLHDNALDGMGYGVAMYGTSMEEGGSTVLITESEFAMNRHAVSTNSPETRFAIEGCYFHDTNPSQGLPDVDAHAHGLASLRLVVRNSRFKHTVPIGVKSGSMEVTGNVFDSSCGDVISEMIWLGRPLHNGNFIANSYEHDVYIGNNRNESGKTLVGVSVYEYPPMKYVAYNVFADGVLWEAEHAGIPAYDADPRPLVGHMYLTAAGGTEPLAAITRGTWYDLHMMAVDPQGADNVAEVVGQIMDPAHAARAANSTAEGLFAAASNYFVRRDASTTQAREGEGDGAWITIAGAGSYVDATGSSWIADGSHRVHAILRFRLLPAAAVGNWRLYGYVRDAEGNVPIPAWLDNQEGWPIRVQ